MSGKITTTQTENSTYSTSTSIKITRYFKLNDYECLLKQDLTDNQVKKNIYLCDGEDIFADNEKAYDIDNQEKLFKKKIKESVSSFVNRGFDNIVVLLGAGASIVNKGKEKEKQKYGKTVNQLKEIINKELKSKSSDFLSIEELSSEIGFTYESIEDLNFENFLSQLEGYCRYNASTVKNCESDRYKLINKIQISRDKIYELIKSNLKYKYNNKFFKHVAFINVALNLATKSNKVHFVTTNYDTLIEEAAEKAQVTVFDGFTFSKDPIFDSDMFEWNLVKDIPYVNTNELEYKKGVINLLKLHGSLSWKKIKGTVYKRSNPSNPLIIYPSSSKYEQTYSEPYFDLFAKFQELLKRKNTLLITSGFSFGDNHISRMIIKSIKTNRTLSMLVSDFTIDNNSPIDKHLREILNDKYPVALLKATLNDDLTDYFGYKEND